MPERFDKATRRREPMRVLLHYVEHLQKAKRRGTNPRKIAKLQRSVVKYSARAAAAPRPARAAKASSSRRANSTSRFTGVTWNSTEEKWKAQVSFKTAEGRKQITIGTYDHEEMAAREYNAYVRRKGLIAKLNPVDENGVLVPKAKTSSRFWGVLWDTQKRKWCVRYSDDSKPSKQHHVGYFVDEEAAALAYNKAVIEVDLDRIRTVNRADPATGRPIPKDQE